MTRARTERGEIEEGFLAYRESGDREALARSLTLAQGELRRVARYYALDPGEEDDVVQATVLTAIERASSFDSSRRLVPWLIGILLKKIAATRRKALRLASDLDVRSERTPFSSAEAAEVRRLVDEALEQLPATYRDVLVMHLHRGMGGQEIAAELHRPQGTIRAQIHRGLRLLRDALPAGLSLGLLGLFRRPASAQPLARASSATARGLSRSARPLSGALLGTALAGGLALVCALAWWLGGDGDGNAQTGRPSPRSATGAGAVASAGGRDPAAAVSRRAASSPEHAGEDVPANHPTPPRLPLRVFERDAGTPVAGALIRASVETLDGERRELVARTASDGTSALEVDPAAVERLTVRPERPGFETLAAVWDRARGASVDEAGLSLPLALARPIGGTIVDASGSPVSGAEVRLTTWEVVDEGTWRPGEEEHVVTTDAAGRWRHDRAPDAGARIVLRIFHPEIATELTAHPQEPAEELWSCRSVIVLEESGPPVDVLVRDPSGAPVGEAVVRLVSRGVSPRAVLELPVGADGRLHLRWPAVPGILVSVRAPGRASRHFLLDRPPDETLDVRMVAEEEREFRLVDETGAPVSGAFVRPFDASWPEAVRSDRDGRFVLGIDPERNLSMEIRRSGVLGTARVLWEPGSEGELVVRRPAVLISSLRDAATGAPPASVRLAISNGRNPIGARRIRAPGELELPFWSSAPAITVEVTAVGYEPLRSRELATRAEVPWSAELVPVPVLDEVVLGRDGLPADFGEVTVVRPGLNPVIGGGGGIRSDVPGVEKVFLRGDGRIVINRPPEPFALVTVCRKGFGYVTSAELDAGAGIEVEPFGSVEGSSPVAGGEPEPVALVIDRFSSRPDGLDLGQELRAKPDAEGRFRFPRVPAGAVRVFSASRPEAAIETLVPPGGTVDVTLR